MGCLPEDQGNIDLRLLNAALPGLGSGMARNRPKRDLVNDDSRREAMGHTDRLRKRRRWGTAVNDCRQTTSSAASPPTSDLLTEEVYRKQIRPVIQTGATAMDGVFGTPPPLER